MPHLRDLTPRLVSLVLLMLIGLSLTNPTAPPARAQADGDPSATFLPLLFGPATRVLIAAAHVDSALSGEPDEAILLQNDGAFPQRLDGWQLATGTRRATFPAGLTLSPGGSLWCAKQASAFQATFGFPPACEWEESDPAVPNLDLVSGGAPTFSNSGGTVHLLNGQGQSVDTLVYGNEERTANGWSGAAMQPYRRGVVPVAGQIWQRKAAVNGLLDTNTARDWSGDLADVTWGRRVSYPGWQVWLPAEMRRVPLLPVTAEANATTRVAVGPEGLYEPLADALASASTTIDLSLYTFEHRELAGVLVEALNRGVRVRLLLEGAPPGGIDELERWALAQIAAAGGEVRFMDVVDDAAADVPNGYRVRYRYLHSKYAVIDGGTEGAHAFVGTDNFNYDSVPLPTGMEANREDEDEDEAIGGRRGVYLFTDAAPVIDALIDLFAADWQPDQFLDLRPFDPTPHPDGDGPPVDFNIDTEIAERFLWDAAAAPFGDAVEHSGSTRFSVISAPENALHPDGGLLALFHRAGAGDEILLTQLYEHKHWGDSTSNPVADPNPRLQAVVDAARRGATVRVLLDSFFDDGQALRSNRATVAYLSEVAQSEGLDLQARAGNPTSGGIHAKLVLVRVSGERGEERWSAVGSLNGSEVSHKINREVVVLVDAPPIHARLAEVFAWDWALSE